MSRAVYLLSNYSGQKQINILIHDDFKDKRVKSNLSNEDTCVGMLKNPVHDPLTSQAKLLEQVKRFCRGRFIDTQCFPAVRIDPTEDYRLRWHLNYAYNSVFVNWYNLQEILQHFAPDYPRMELENSDVVKTIKRHKAIMAPSSGKYIDETIKYNYTQQFFEESLRLFQNVYKDLNVLKSWMMVKQRCVHSPIDEKKPKIKIHIYGKDGHERTYEKVKTWDGVYSLEVPIDIKNKMFKWYATEKRQCVKQLKSKLEPYFVAGYGWTAPDIFWKSDCDRCGLQHLFVSLCQQTKRKSVQPVDKKECEQIKKEVIAYLDAFVNAVGDQTKAREFVEQHKDEVTSDTEIE